VRLKRLLNGYGGGGLANSAASAGGRVEAPNQRACHRISCTDNIELFHN
jgi:hypothetical protein